MLQAHGWDQAVAVYVVFAWSCVHPNKCLLTCMQAPPSELRNDTRCMPYEKHVHCVTRVSHVLRGVPLRCSLPPAGFGKHMVVLENAIVSVRTGPPEKRAQNEALPGSCCVLRRVPVWIPAPHAPGSSLS